VKHTTRALSGPPSTGAAIAMDGGVADTACTGTVLSFYEYMYES